jgi:dolichol kinase
MRQGKQFLNNERSDSEISRQAVHMLVALFALLLRWLSYPQALACAVAAIVFNVFILPRLPGSRERLYRAGERESGFSVGILMYPVSVFILILAFPVPVAAAMWGVLSFGDGMATIVGSRVGNRRLPWNRKKTLEGLLAFVLGGLPAAVFLYWWTLPNVASSPPWWRSSAANTLFGALGVGQITAVSLVTVIVCAFLETLETRLDDNLVAPLGGACVMVGLIYAFCG